MRQCIGDYSFSKKRFHAPESEAHKGAESSKDHLTVDWFPIHFVSIWEGTEMDESGHGVDSRSVVC